eukprot:1187760-Prymnesium_polylepis.1
MPPRSRGFVSGRHATAQLWVRVRAALGTGVCLGAACRTKPCVRSRAACLFKDAVVRHHLRSEIAPHALA